jgi:transcriptional regulator with XRE-family HTH domain
MTTKVNTVSPTARQFAKRLRALREAAGKSQGDLADEAGLSRTYLNQLEAGKRDPSLSTLTRLARALRVKLEALIGAQGG